MKRLLMPFLVAVLCISSLMLSNPVSANEESATSGFQNVGNNKVYTQPVSNEQLQKIRESNTDYSVPITFEQAVARKAELTGTTPESVLEELKNQNNDFNALASSCQWMETQTTVTVSSTYKPKLVVIPRVCRDGSFGWVDVNTEPFTVGFKADTKKFDGTIRVELKGNGFRYLANGNFYNHGTVTHQGTTGANAVFTATYSVASSSNHYKAIYTGLKYRYLF